MPRHPTRDRQLLIPGPASVAPPIEAHQAFYPRINSGHETLIQPCRQATGSGVIPIRIIIMLLTMVRVKWYFPHVKLADPRTVEYNQPVYHWLKHTEVRPRQDSGSQQNHASNVAQMPDPAPAQFRSLHGAIQGTPQTGWYDLLDSSQYQTSIIRYIR